MSAGLGRGVAVGLAAMVAGADAGELRVEAAGGRAVEVLAGGGCTGSWGAGPVARRVLDVAEAAPGLVERGRGCGMPQRVLADPDGDPGLLAELAE
jgi:hypothetical protein